MPSWQEYPLLRIVLAYMAGIFFISEIRPNILIPICFFASSLIIAVCCRLIFPTRKDLSALSAGACIIIFFFNAGFYQYHQRDTVVGADHFSQFINYQKQVFLCKLKDSPNNSKTPKVEVDVIAIGNSSHLNSSQGSLLLYIKNKSDSISYRAGDIILVQGRILTTPKNTNPHAFDYQAFLHNRGIDHQSFIEDGHHQLYKQRQLNPIRQWSKETKSKFLDVFDIYLTEGNEKAVVLAMILGYRNNLSHELYTSYTDTGIVHVLAVSGLHVGIIASLLLFVLKWVPEPTKKIRFAKTVIIISAICFYALITGSAPAVVRATIMFSLILINWYFDEDSNLFNSLAFAALLMLIYDPRMLFQASFQFSFLALSSIVYFHPKLLSVWRPTNKYIDILYQFMLVSVAAQILVFPLTIYYFHKFPTYFILSSLFAVPAAYVIIYGGILIQVLHALHLPFIVALVSKALTYSIRQFNSAITFIQELPCSVVEGIWAEKSTMLFLFLTTLSIMGFVSFKFNKSYLKLAIFLVFCCVSGSSFRYYNSHSKALVCIYDIHKGYTIDFIQGRQIYSVIDTSLSKEKGFFAFFNNRIKYGADCIHILDEDLDTKVNGLIGKSNFLQVKNTTFYITPNWFPKPINGCAKVDYLIISKGCKAPPSLILDYINPRSIICDKSISKYQTIRWKEIAKAQHIPFRSVYDDGAINIDLNYE